MGCGPSAKKRATQDESPDEAEVDAADAADVEDVEHRVEEEGSEEPPNIEPGCLSRALPGLHWMDGAAEQQEVKKLQAGVEVGLVLREASRVAHVSKSLKDIGTRAIKLPQMTADLMLEGLLDLAERALLIYLVEFESELSGLCEDIWPPRKVVHMGIARQTVLDCWTEVQRSSKAESFEVALDALIMNEYLPTMHAQHCRHRDKRLQTALEQESRILLQSGSQVVCKQYKNAHRQYQQLLDAFVDAAEAQAKTAVQFELDLALPGFFKRYDLDLSGTVNSVEELDNLVTNLVYSFRDYIDFPPMEQIRPLISELTDATSWELTRFTAWFNATVRNRTSIAAEDL